MRNMSTDAAIKRVNAAILERLAGVPANLELPTTEIVGRSLNISPSCGDARSEPGSSAQSDPVPQANGRALRLVWCATQPAKCQP